MLRTTFEPMRQEVRGSWSTLHNEERHDLYSPRNNIIVIKSRRMRWAVNVARMVKKINTYKILVCKHEGNNRLEDLDADWKIILKWILKKQDGRAWIGFI